MFQRLRKFLKKIFQPLTELLLLRTLKKGEKEFERGRGKLLTSVEDLD